MITWIVQRGVLDDSDELRDAALSRGHSWEWVDESWSAPPPKNCIFRGSVEFVRRHQGRWFTEGNYRCSHYYNFHPFRNFLLNKRCLWMPWGLLERSRGEVMDFVPGNRAFIRPDSGGKEFTGTTLSFKWWADELKIIRGDNPLIRDNTMVLVTPHAAITDEVRVLYRRDTPISWGVYVGSGDGFSPFLPEGLLPPDPLYTIDYCRLVGGGWRILEINSFVSAGLYDMDMGAVAEAAEDEVLGR